jgi:crotonobetainyl-CoA:carnitine CoA-transferase CaiB-like acyl-CoA transferase
MTDATPLFAGLKVIDCATYIAAPIAATVFADFGADVIKIESPGEGDPWRHLHTRPGVPNSPHPYTWLVDNRNKRGLVLDLKHSEGREVLERLVAGADIFITNLPLPVRARLGVRYADFAAKYPRLIYGSFTAYGEEGEEAGKTGFDLTAYWARSGLMDQVRADRDTMPARAVGGMGDHPTGVAFYAGLLTALYRRATTGLGAEVRSNLLVNGMWSNAMLVQAALCGAAIPSRPPREQSTNALGATYRCRDGRWLMLTLTSEAKQWPALARAVGHADLVHEPRFHTMELRRANAPALLAILDAAFAAEPLAYWRRALDAAGLTFGIVGTVEEIADDPQAHAAGILRPIEGTDMLTIDSPFTVGNIPKVPITKAPGHGEHTGAILHELGYSAGEIAALRAARAVIGH